MVDGASSLVESGDLAKFCGAFEKAQESLDEKLHMLPTAAAAATSGAIEDAETPKLPDVTVWLRTASNGRVCMQCSLEVAMLDASYRDTGGPAGIITLTMIDVTAAETKKEIVARRYELAYNEKAPDSVLADFFASWMKENTKAVPVPGTRRPSAEEYEGAPAGEDGSVAKKEGASSGAVLPGVRQPGDPYVRGDEISSGVRAYLERRRILVKAFPDLKFTMLEQTSQGDSVYTSWQWTGTHLGPYPCDNGEELSPSGARVHVHGISIDVFDRHTRIVDHSVFYDENAIRAQLEIKASASRGRDTRSIIRRAHNARKKLMQESSITVQLYLSVRKAQGGSSGAAVVGAMMRPVVSTAPRYSPMELTMMSTMEVYYASKATAHIGSFDTDGFCLCDGGESSSLEPIPVTSSSPSHSAQQPPLCSLARLCEHRRLASENSPARQPAQYFGAGDARRGPRPRRAPRQLHCQARAVPRRLRGALRRLFAARCPRQRREQQPRQRCRDGPKQCRNWPKQRRELRWVQQQREQHGNARPNPRHRRRPLRL